MAATGTPTPNIGLRIPIGTDPASVDDINYNSNLLDTKLGAVGSDSVQDQLDTLNGNIASINESINDLHSYLGHTYVNNNEGFTITLGSQNRVFLFYRSYQPNILYIDNTGSVAVVAGQNQSITITASNNVLTIKNTIGWGMGFVWLII